MQRCGAPLPPPPLRPPRAPHPFNRCHSPPARPAPQDKALQAARSARWLGVDAETRVRVKDLVIRTLTSPCAGARRAAAQVVGKIAYIEYPPAPADGAAAPATTWPELLPGLTGWIQNAELPEPVRAASLAALTYVVEELDRYETSPLTDAQVDGVSNLVLGALSVMPPSPDMQREAIKALRVLLPFMAEDFQKPELGAPLDEWEKRAPRRNAVVERVSALAAGGLLPATQEEALMAATSIVELYYDALPPYMGGPQGLAALTAHFASLTVNSEAAKVRCSSPFALPSAKLLHTPRAHPSSHHAQTPTHTCTPLKPPSRKTPPRR